MRVIAYDPGLATGFASWDDGKHATAELDIETMYRTVDMEVDDSDIVVCESFVITARTARLSAAPWSLELIGCIKRACYLAGKELVMQAPSTAKRVASDEHLRNYGWWTPGSDHARDASRHLMYYLLVEKVINARDVMST